MKTETALYLSPARPHLFLSIAHTPEEIDKFVNDFEEFLVKNAELLAVR